MPTTVRAVLGCLALATFVAGVPACATGQDGGGTVAGTAAPVTTTLAVPPVEHPLDLRPFEDDLCSLLPPADRVVLGLSGYGRATASPGACMYEDGLGTGAIVLQLELDRSPLTSAYEHREDNELFQALRIRGLPAVAAARVATEKACTIVVGTAQDQGLTLIHYPDVGQAPGAAADKCARMNTIAEAVLTNAGG